MIVLNSLLRTVAYESRLTESVRRGLALKLGINAKQTSVLEVKKNTATNTTWRNICSTNIVTLIPRGRKKAEGGSRRLFEHIGLSSIRKRRVCRQVPRRPVATRRV